MKKLTFIAAILLLASMVLSACGATPASTPVATATPQPTQTPWIQTQIVEVEAEVDETPEPAAPACTYSVIALDPGQGVQWTPSNVWVLSEVVNFNADTITLELFYTTSPVKAFIQGEVHTNLWYYCDKDVAEAGADSQYQERLSESKIVNGWAYGMSVSPPVVR